MKRATFITSKFLSLTLLLSTVFFTITSCRDEEKTKTVVIEKQAEKPKAEEADGTSLSIGDDGVEFSTKDGDKKTEVSIKD